MRLKLYIPITIVTSIAAIWLAGSAFAQEIVIETSAEDHGNRFFGEGVLQVVVIDADAEDGDTIEEISIKIQADHDVGGSTSTNILIPETSQGSGKFEFFLVHVNASAVGPADLDSINNAGVEGDGICITDCAPFVTFGLGGDIDVDADLYEEVRFEILEGNTEITARYEETAGELRLDRNSYGTNSFVYISIVDQDANVNPHGNDEFTVDPNSDPNDDLLILDGGVFEDIIIFRETGDNTAIFEGRYLLGDSMIVDSKSLALTLFEKANYGETLEVPENDSNNTDEITFTVGNSDGTIDVGRGQRPIIVWDPTLVADKSLYALGESVHVAITDQDANVNSDTSDVIYVHVSSGRSEIDIFAHETGSTTGVFEANFKLSAETDIVSGAIAPSGSVMITYTDKRPADYFEKIQTGENPEKDFILEIDVELPIRTGIETTDITVPIATDFTGGSGPFEAGDSVTLSTTISNNNEDFQHFIALLDVRDSNGVTVFLALQSGTLEPSAHTDVGVLWQPDQAGTYEVQTFVVSDISAVEMLSPIAKAEITINQIH